MKRLTFLVLFIGLILCFAKADTAFAWGPSLGYGYGSMGASGTLGRVIALWEYKGGGLIAMDDIARGMRITYCNGHPLYGKLTMPPTSGEATSISFVFDGVSKTVAGLSLDTFFKDDATLKEKLRELFSGKTDEEIQTIMEAARKYVAEDISDNGIYCTSISKDLFSQADMIYQYDQSSLLAHIYRTAIDDEGNPLKDGNGTRLWTTETYTAGLLTSRDSYFFGTKMVDGEPVDLDNDGAWDLDKTNLLSTREEFEYKVMTDDNGQQIGSCLISSNQVLTKDYMVDTNNDGTLDYKLMSAGDVVGHTENNEFGQALKEFGIGYVSVKDKVVNANTLLVEHNYYDASGKRQALEQKTINYQYFSDSEAKMAFRVTDRIYNEATGQLDSTKTQLIIQHFGDAEFKAAYDFNADSTIDMKDVALLVSQIGEPVTDANRKFDVNNDGQINQADSDLVTALFGKSGRWDEALGTADESAYVYNSLGQISYIQSKVTDTEGGTGTQTWRTYNVLGREFVRFQVH